MSISTAQDYIDQVRRNIHDTASSDFTDPQLLGMVNEARQRVALDTHCYRQFITGLNTVAQQETYLYNGALGGVSVTNGGTGYVNPTVSFIGGSGSGASASAVLSGGVITGINMTSWGSGYSTSNPPTIQITDSAGVNAAASPIILYNIFDVLSITVLWGSLGIMFGYLPFTAFQAYCRAYRMQYETPAIFTLHQGIMKSFVYPIPDQVYPMEMDVITQPTDLALTTTPETQILAPWNDGVQFYASFLAIASLQQYEKSMFWRGLYEKRVKELPATAFSRRVFNPYRTYGPMVRRM